MDRVALDHRDDRADRRPADRPEPEPLDLGEEERLGLGQLEADLGDPVEAAPDLVAVTALTTEVCAAQDVLATVKTLGTSCAAFDGTTLYSGSLGAVAIGDPATGAQAGDRTLAAQGSETLCIQVHLPLAAGNAYQAASTVTTLTFSAEQTANNP